MSTIDRYIAWIKGGLARPGKTQSGLADALGIAHPQITHLLSGKRRMKVDEIDKIAEYLELPPPARMAPIVGLAGAGPDGSVLFSAGDGNFGEVPLPEDASDTIAALEVRGTSMRGMADDGWIIFYEDPVTPAPEFFGEPCVVWLEDGRVLVKYLQPGRSPGFYDLESVNAPTIRDVAVRQVALVTDIKTRRAANRFIKRNPDIELQQRRLDGHKA